MAVNLEIRLERAPEGWRGWSDIFPGYEARGPVRDDVRERVQALIERALEEESRTAVDAAGDVISSVREPYLQAWRACEQAAVDDASLQRFKAIQAPLEERLCRILETRGLKDALRYFDSDESAKQSLFKIVRVLLSSPEDPKRHFNREAREIELYNTALAGIDQAFEAARARTIAPGSLLTGKIEGDYYALLLAARNVLQGEFQAFMESRQPDVIQSRHLGGRGGAADPGGARRGMARRSLKELIPESYPEHDALATRLMQAADLYHS